MTIVVIFFCVLVGFAVNLAVSLANKCQLNVGLLDADVYGPSIPTMMKLNGKPEVSEGDTQVSSSFLSQILYIQDVWQVANAGSVETGLDSKLYVMLFSGSDDYINCIFAFST